VIYSDYFLLTVSIANVNENIFVRRNFMLLFLLFHYTMHFLLGAFHDYDVPLSPLEVYIVCFAVN